jgi:hypothetical protein
VAGFGGITWILIVPNIERNTLAWLPIDCFDRTFVKDAHSGPKQQRYSSFAPVKVAFLLWERKAINHPKHWALPLNENEPTKMVGSHAFFRRY